MDVLTIIMSFLAIVISIITYRTTLKRDKKRDTIQAYKDLQPYLYQYYEYQNDEIELFVDDRNSEEYKSLSNSLAQIELFSTGVRGELYDFIITYNLSHGFIDGALRDRLEYMLEMKAYKGQPFYENTRWLLEEMDKETIRQTK